MRLEVMTAADVEIRIRSETDPVMMAELGGPRPVADIERAHERSLDVAAEGKSWPLKVILEDSRVAGSVIDFTYAGRRLQCNRWRIELWPAAEMEDARG